MPRFLLVAYHAIGGIIGLILTVGYAYGELGLIKLLVSYAMIAGIVWSVRTVSLALHDWKVVDINDNVVKDYRKVAEQIQEAVDEVLGNKHNAHFNGSVQIDGDGPPIEKQN